MGEEFAMTRLAKEAVVSATVLGAILGAGAAAPLSRRLGRKRVLLAADAVFVCGAALMSSAPVLGQLVAGRLVVGLGIGLASMVVPMYLSEVAPLRLRGALVTVNVALITLGQFISYAVDAALAGAPGNWRWMLGLSAVPALVQLLGVEFLPESPRWHLFNGRREEALKEWMRIRSGEVKASKRGPDEEDDGRDGIGDEEEDGFGKRWKHPVDHEEDEGHEDHEEEFKRVEAEFKTVEAEVEAQRRLEEQGGVPWNALLTDPALRRAMVVGATLQVLQQLVGINTVMYYSPTIVQESGLGGGTNEAAILSSMAIAGANCVMTLVALPAIDRYGRRALLLLSLSGTFLALVTLAASFMLGPSYAWLSLLGLVAYTVMFAPGMGPVPWALNAEIYPLAVREKGNAVATMANWAANLAMSLSFLSISQAISTAGAFLLYAIIALLAIAFVILFVPETKGRSIQQISWYFQHPHQEPAAFHEPFSSCRVPRDSFYFGGSVE